MSMHAYLCLVCVPFCVCFGALQCLHDDVGGWVTQSSPRDIMNHSTSLLAELQPSTIPLLPYFIPPSLPPLCLCPALCYFFLPHSLLYGILLVFHYLAYFWYLQSAFHLIIMENSIKLIRTFSQLNSSPALTVSFTCMSNSMGPFLSHTMHSQSFDNLWNSYLQCISNLNMSILVAGGVSTSPVALMTSSITLLK